MDTNFYTVSEIAERLRVSSSTVYNLVDAGRLVCYRIGRGRGAIRFDEEQIAAFLESCRVTEPPDEDGPLQHLH